MMTRRGLLLGATAVRTAGGDGSKGASSNGWAELFDGRTGEGWVEVLGEAFPRTWKVEEGCLRSVKSDRGGFQDLRTRGEYREFEFEFEWRIEAGGNSGVKYLINRTNRWAAKDGGFHARGRGAEYQLIDDAAEANPAKQCGALYGRIAPRVKAARAVGVWNGSRIVVAGGRVEHWLNGERVVEYQAEAKAGPIVLQHHNSNAWFRGLRVRVV